MKKRMTINHTPASLAALVRGDQHNAEMASKPGGIEAQEAAGVAQFSLDATLPKECARTDLELLGVKFGDDHDDILINAKLPPGWRKRASDTDHRVTFLVDDKGRKRGDIFYKAAFYDRFAYLTLKRRYIVNCFIDGNNVNVWRCAVLDGEMEIHFLGEVERDDNARIQELRAQGEAWLDERFPAWRDSSAYWD